MLTFLLYELEGARRYLVHLYDAATIMLSLFIICVWVTTEFPFMVKAICLVFNKFEWRQTGNIKQYLLTYYTDIVHLLVSANSRV